MAVKINISGVTANGDVNILNGMKVKGKNDTDINIKETSVGGKSQILNDMNISENSSVNIEIENSEIKESSRVLNDLDIEDGQLNVELKNLRLSEGTEFMNNKKIERNSKEANKKDGLLGRILKSMLKEESTEGDREVVHSQKNHDNFVDEISNKGKLKNMNTSEAIESAKKHAEQLKGKQKSTDKTR